MKDFQFSKKTKSPACCSFDCCGSKFGRIGRDSHMRHSHRNHGENRIIRARRYAKNVIRRITQLEIQSELEEMKISYYESQRWLDE